MTTSILDLPLEVIESILLFATPSGLAAFSQTCKTYFSLIYSSRDSHFWRNYFFRQSLYDDPRLRFRPNLLKTVHWDKLFQRWTAAANVIRGNRPIKDVATIRSLLEIVDYSRPGPGVSLNLLHLEKLFNEANNVAARLKDFIKDETDVTCERMQLTHRLKMFIGWPSVERTREARLAARCYVYDLRNYVSSNSYGPLLPGGTGRVNWVHLFKVREVLVNNIMDFVDDYQSLLPWGSLSLQQGCAIDSSATKDERDWAGITGKWQIIVAFCDHRDLIAYNNRIPFSSVVREPVTDIFEDEDFEEALRTLDFDFTVAGVVPADEANERWPSRPTLKFTGKMGDTHRINGMVYMGPDDQVYWSFVSGEGGPMWSIEAVQIGGAGSIYGAIGTWTTIMHDEDDPVGPTWIRKYT